MTFYFSIQCLFDFTAIALQAVSNSLGYHRYSFGIYFFGYFIWILPLAYYLSLSYQLVGIWIAFGTGAFLIMTLQLIIIFRCDLTIQHNKIMKTINLLDS